MTERKPNVPTPMTSQLVSMLMMLKDNEAASEISISTPSSQRPVVNAPSSSSAEGIATLFEGRQTRRSSQQQLDQHAQEQTEEQAQQTEEICTCKKSRCLKLYCVCFAASIVCKASCKCQMCQNSDAFSKQRNKTIQAILDRNPTAFSSKFKQVSTDGETLAHKSGCRCRRSMCLKKYCECFQAAMPCGDSCSCIECMNKVGVDRSDAASTNTANTAASASASASAAATGTTITTQQYSFGSSIGSNRLSLLPVVATLPTSTSTSTATSVVGYLAAAAAAVGGRGGGDGRNTVSSSLSRQSSVSSTISSVSSDCGGIGTPNTGMSRTSLGSNKEVPVVATAGTTTTMSACGTTTTIVASANTSSNSSITPPVARDVQSSSSSGGSSRVGRDDVTGDHSSYLTSTSTPSTSTCYAGSSSSSSSGNHSSSSFNKGSAADINNKGSYSAAADINNMGVGGNNKGSGGNQWVIINKGAAIVGDYSQGQGQGCFSKLLDAWHSTSGGLNFNDARSQMKSILGKTSRIGRNSSKSATAAAESSSEHVDDNDGDDVSAGTMTNYSSTVPPPLKKRRLAVSKTVAADDANHFHASVSLRRTGINTTTTTSTSSSSRGDVGGASGPFSILNSFAETTAEMFSSRLERGVDVLTNIMRPSLLTRVRPNKPKSSTAATKTKKISTTATTSSSAAAKASESVIVDSSSSLTALPKDDVLSFSSSSSCAASSAPKDVPRSNNSKKLTTTAGAAAAPPPPARPAQGTWKSNGYYDSSNLTGIAVLAKLISSPSPGRAGGGLGLPLFPKNGGVSTVTVRDFDKAQFSGSTEASSTADDDDDGGYCVGDDDKENNVNVPVSRAVRRPVPLSSSSSSTTTSSSSATGIVTLISATKKPPLHRGSNSVNGKQLAQQQQLPMAQQQQPHQQQIGMGLGLVSAGAMSPSVRGFVRTNLLSPLCKVGDEQQPQQ